MNDTRQQKCCSSYSVVPNGKFRIVLVWNLETLGSRCELTRLRFSPRTSEKWSTTSERNSPLGEVIGIRNLNSVDRWGQLHKWQPKLFVPGQGFKLFAVLMVGVNNVAKNVGDQLHVSGPVRPPHFAVSSLCRSKFVSISIFARLGAVKLGYLWGITPNEKVHFNITH